MKNPLSKFISKHYLILIIFFLLSVSCILLFTVKDSTPVTNVKKTIANAVNKPDPKPTPYPFYELTIPYLRSLQYISSLGELQKVAENDSYTSYVTNYTSDGFRINGLLTEPKGTRPAGGWPAIVFIHGYIPPKTYATQGQPYSTYVDYLARNGFAVFKIDLRGHGDSQGEPGGAYYSGDYVKDALNAYAALQGADFINPQKIGLWGHSMAGNVSLRTFAVKPDIPAVVIWAGAGYSYTDLIKYKITDASYDPSQASQNGMNRRGQIRKLYGDPDPSKVFWQQMAPTSYLTDLKGALELHHAEDDAVVNIGYSRDLTTLLDKTSVPHEFYEYATGGHNISGESFATAMDRTVAFYKKYLQ